MDRAFIMSIFRKIIFIAMLAGGLLPSLACHAADKLIILVRHAEKREPDSADTRLSEAQIEALRRDPPLSTAGYARAQALPGALAQFPLSRLIATQYLRTRETLAPIAAERQLGVEIIAANAPIAEHIAQLVQAAKAAEGNVLIAGHSNTLPLLVQALGGPKIAPIAETDYGQLFILTLGEDERVTLMSGHYGAQANDTN
ncbi:histidine phosphatase family protein [Shewanella salipaludis]|uniref:Histidine phosphatase family protein n=1 Tax=Shewanella salipaludis TaxID=2723052 RepID=A0A972G6L3_9GAMM|nr:histidine phosphatase family protein [Shewanella salipaludis]NMH65445.1 histidine phosphatase family protein [Shewanella salipaludis]